MLGARTNLANEENETFFEDLMTGTDNLPGIRSGQVIVKKIKKKIKKICQKADIVDQNRTKKY